MKVINVTATTIDGLRKSVQRVAAIISAPSDLLPTYGASRDFGHPHIEVDQNGYHYIVVERGQEIERWSTQNPNELLFWVFDSATFSMAVAYELIHRMEGQDCRRIIFEKKLELLGALDSDWRARAGKAQKAILERHPFDDFSSIRAQLAKKLRDEGNNPDTAWNMACEKYPIQ
jgi:hypothetical protein